MGHSAIERGLLGKGDVWDGASTHSGFAMGGLAGGGLSGRLAERTDRFALATQETPFVACRAEHWERLRTAGPK